MVFFPLLAGAQNLQNAPQTPVLIEDASTTEVALIAPPGAVYTPKDVVMVKRNGTVEDLVSSEFIDAPVMVRVAKAESTFDPSAKNPHSSAEGVFQILKGTWHDYGCAGSRLNATDNIACARKMYDAQGTTPWLSSKDGWQ